MHIITYYLFAYFILSNHSGGKADSEAKLTSSEADPDEPLPSTSRVGEQSTSPGASVLSG